MRIVIDLQAAQGESGYRGIGRYSLSLAREMVRAGANRGHEIFVILNGKYPESITKLREELFGLITQDRIVTIALPSPSAGVVEGRSWCALSAELLREEFLYMLQPDVVYVSSLFEGWVDETNVSIASGLHRLPTAVTLYDLIPYVMSDIYLLDDRFKTYYLGKIDQLKMANFLLSISDHSRLEAVELLQISESKVANISAAISDRFVPSYLDQEEKDTLLKKYGIELPFILYVPGGFDPRKNFDRLIESFSQLPEDLRSGLQLVIGSKFPPDMANLLNAKAELCGLRERQLILTGYIPDEELIAMYGICRLSVFPSLHEGFGLPVLEAMACGAAVLASRTTSLREVVGFDDALFDPESVVDITRVVQHALMDAGFLETVKTHCQQHIKNFSWERSATIALDSLEGAFKANNLPMITSNESELDERYQAIVCQANGLLQTPPLQRELSMVRHTLLANNNVVRRLLGQKQLLVDISELVVRDAKSGIQRVVRSILMELLKNPPADFQVEAVYTPDGKGLLYAKQFVARFLGESTEGVTDYPVTFGSGDEFVGLDLTAHMFPEFTGTLHHLREAGVHIHYVVYDLTPLMDTRWHTAGMTQAFTHWIDALADSAHNLICISDAVASDVRRWFVTKRPDIAKVPRIAFFHLGADIDSSQPTRGLPESANEVLSAVRSRPSFLAVGTLEPRKGHTQIIDAFEVLWSRGVDVNLVVVGKVGWNMEAILERLRSHPMLNTRLFWLEGVTDEYLQHVYEESAALIAASEYEGFGLPLIEAAQHSLPIIARDIPVFREVAGGHAFWFDGTTGGHLAHSIQEWLALDSRGAAPQSNNMPWLTWEQSTSKLLAQIEEHRQFRL